MLADDDRSKFTRGLDRADDVLSTIGLFVSGIVFAAGLAGLVFVILRVTATTPPSFGSQGEWLYAAVGCLLVAGWGFGQAAKFYARRRRRTQPSFEIPNVEVRDGGISIELNPSRGAPNAGSGGHTWSWSFSSDTAPIQQIELTEAQISAAAAEAGPGADWDAIAQRVNPAYGTLSVFEQRLYRHALQTSVARRGSK